MLSLLFLKVTMYLSLAPHFAQLDAPKFTRYEELNRPFAIPRLTWCAAISPATEGYERLSIKAASTASVHTSNNIKSHRASQPNCSNA